MFFFKFHENQISAASILVAFLTLKLDLKTCKTELIFMLHKKLKMRQSKHVVFLGLNAADPTKT